MAQQIINIGTADNDGTGDPLRTSFNKTNQNFTELYAGGATIADDAVTYAKMQNVSAASLLIGRGSAAGAGDPQEITLGTNLSMSGTTLNATGGGGGSGFTAPQGRLTLQTATPVMITTQSAKTTIFYSAYVGDQVPIYNGTTWTMTAITGGEISVLTTNTTKSPAAIGANKVNDWFIWSDAGTLRIGHGPDWTNDTTRAAGTALVMVNGIWLNNVAITNGPAASRGTYVGTTRSNASSQIDWILGTFATSVTANASLNIWNCYNRVNVETISGDSGNASSSASSFQQNLIGNRVNFVCGLAEDAFEVTYNALMGANTTGYCVAAIGLNSTTTKVGGTSPVIPPPTALGNGVATYGATVVGYNFVVGLELAALGGTSTYYGTTGAVGTQTGLVFKMRM